MKGFISHLSFHASKDGKYNQITIYFYNDLLSNKKSLASIDKIECSKATALINYFFAPCI